MVSVAKKYQNQGVPLPDLINEGNLGLIRAAHKFDETKGIKFISYAVWWIRQAILQALAEQSRIVRVPLNRAGALHRIGRRSSTLLQELGREPTVEEIAEELEISREEVERTLAISQSHLSLDAPVTPGEDNRLLDYLPDQYSPGPEDEAYQHALKETVEDALSTLKEREAKRVNKEKVNYLSGIIFNDFVDNMEKIGDHLTNIAQDVLRHLRWDVEPE